MSLRHRVSALVYEWPRFLRHVGEDWKRIHNRDEAIVGDGRGIQCQWNFGSDLHIVKVYPSTGPWLLRRALGDWPVRFKDEPANSPDRPLISFLIGHRGLERLPHLLTTLRSVAAQRDVRVECIVVEQAAKPEIESHVPKWVRYIHTPVEPGLAYCRSATFNAAARLARGQILVAHDNDLVVPESYASELVARAREGHRFMDLKRFIFYIGEDDSRAVFAGGPLHKIRATTVVQNLHGGSIAATRDAFVAIGGFDEDFVGWGGEDLEFWERAVSYGGDYSFGYLPMIHLWHPPQKGKAQADAPAVRRYYEIRDIPPTERIKRLLAQQRR